MLTVGTSSPLARLASTWPLALYVGANPGKVVRKTEKHEPIIDKEVSTRQVRKGVCR